MSKTSNKKKRNIDKASINAKISSMIENGRKEIFTKKELEQYPIGSMISYMNVNDIFKIGGFITNFDNDFFIYITPDFSQKYRARYKNIKKMIVGDIYSTKNDLVSLVKTNQNKTNYPIVVDDIIIYYATNNFHIKRFKNTQKYQKYIQWIDYFKS